ncbi:tail assembly chaperone [Mycobacterium phage LilMcDreamy]|uniref:Tail assembly chaperone n=1 Tax=Mycobacterium phage LilMcDreamy TaxID=2652422 RepID=A0A5P8D6H6_9CAUD|nr:tail assembly chaperone [Mycobacterium phage LilMcDreamy]QFP94643.1 hypothetical protein SEA_LILMCDREAMY_23 [Mycobacterium phage LilMcDreamy]
MAEFGTGGTKIDPPKIAPQAEPTGDQLAPPPDDDDDNVIDVETDSTAAAIADLATDHADDPRDTVKAEVVDSNDVPSSSSPGTAVALAEKFDVATTGEKWDHDFLTFEGDRLGIRVPTRQALAAFSLATGKYVDVGVKNDLTGLFIARHLSTESYGRVFSRLMDPDDEGYDVDTVGELFNAIVTASLQPTEGDDKKA